MKLRVMLFPIYAIVVSVTQAKHTHFIAHKYERLASIAGNISLKRNVLLDELYFGLMFVFPFHFRAHCSLLVDA